MNIRWTRARIKEKKVVNEGVLPRGERVPIANQENVNEAVSPQVSQGPQAPNIEGYVSNVEIRATFKAFTQLVMTQSQVVINHVVALANLGVGPQ